MCPTIEGFTPHEVCIIRALRHISACFKNLFLYPLGTELCMRAFLTLVPPTWRIGAEHYISVVMKSYESWMPEDEIQRVLADSDINYNISDILRVIEYYDRIVDEGRDASGKMCGEEDCESCMVVFAAALQYLSPTITRPDHIHALRRIKVLGEHIEPQVKMVSRKSNPSYIKLIDPRPRVATPPVSIIPSLSGTDKSKIVEVDGIGLTEFSDSDIIAVLVDSTSKSLEGVDPTTSAVFTTYPYANIYKPNRGLAQNLLGTVTLKIPKDPKTKVSLSSTKGHRFVACLVSKFNLGGPKKVIDTVSNRKKWFDSAAKRLFSLPKVKGKSIAFSKGQLSPKGYLDTVRDLANTTGTKLFLLTGKTVEHTPSKKSKESSSEDVTPSSEDVTSSEMYSPGPEITSPPEGLQESVNRGVVYFEIMGPLNLADADYSSAVKKLNNMSPSSRNNLLGVWKKKTPSDLKKVVKAFLKD